MIAADDKNFLFHLRKTRKKCIKQHNCFCRRHRLSTILEADRIVVMECGRIVDIGRHEELLGRCELYPRLYNMQFRAHENICGCETDLVES